jgi:uncharacterized membrane protein YbhN (UPF0104 family)
MQLRDAASYRIIIGALRLVLVPVALIWLLAAVSGIEWSHAVIAVPTALVLALIVNQIALAVFAVRMQLTLRLCGIEIGWLTAQRIHLQSMFYFFVLPMTVGLEVARFVKIREQRPEASKANLTIALVLDRLVGAGSALALAIICLPFVKIDLPWRVSTVNLGLAFGAVGALVTVLLLWPRLRRWLVEMFDMTRGRRLGFTLLLVLSMGMHVIFAWGVKFGANSLGLAIGFVDTVFAIAGSMLLFAIPIAVAGAGPAEAGAAALFLLLGYDPKIAVTAGILPYLARLIGALEGGAWEAAESGRNAIGEMERFIIARNARNRQPATSGDEWNENA